MIVRRRFYQFIRLGRPLFLVGAIVLHLLGVVMALYRGADLNLPAFVWGQIAITAIQWMTHYSNDYFDQTADRANTTPTHWSGGSRVLVEGGLPPQVALITALTLAGIAAASALILALIVQTGAFTLPLLLTALCLAWFYSAPPLRLHSRGLGEITTTLLVPGLVPLTGFYLQSGRLELFPVLLVLPLMGLQFCMMLTIELPDAAGDADTGKRTQIVRHGAVWARHWHNIVLIMSYLSLPLLTLVGMPPLVALLAGCTLPLAMWRIWLGHGDHPEYWNQMGFISVALLIGTAALEMVGLMVLILLRFS
ncbi:MAG TPA: prenyltransferase [Phototrophicaceae bacterium]|jgi:1,4-dihydroxy-2-naphthoate octaprenyltransferase|nr:prenyltransferase [Phototrophicaceae bacterium]